MENIHRVCPPPSVHSCGCGSVIVLVVYSPSVIKIWGHCLLPLSSILNHYSTIAADQQVCVFRCPQADCVSSNAAPVTSLALANNKHAVPMKLLPHRIQFGCECHSRLKAHHPVMLAKLLASDTHDQHFSPVLRSATQHYSTGAIQRRALITGLYYYWEALPVIHQCSIGSLETSSLALTRESGHLPLTNTILIVLIQSRVHAGSRREDFKDACLCIYMNIYSMLIKSFAIKLKS